LLIFAVSTVFVNSWVCKNLKGICPGSAKTQKPERDYVWVCKNKNLKRVFVRGLQKHKNLKGIMSGVCKNTKP